MLIIFSELGDVEMLLVATTTPGNLPFIKVEDGIKEEDEQRNDNRTGWTPETPLALKLSSGE